MLVADGSYGRGRWQGQQLDPRWTELNCMKATPTFIGRGMKAYFALFQRRTLCTCSEVVYTSERVVGRPVFVTMMTTETGCACYRNSGPHADEYVIATGLCLPYNGEDFASSVNNIDDRRGSSRDAF